MLLKAMGFQLTNGQRRLIVAFLYRTLGLALGLALFSTAALALDRDDVSADDAGMFSADGVNTTRSTSATNGVAARKQRIELAKAQVENAQQMLDEAKQKGSMTDAEIDAVQNRIDQARDALDSVDTKLQTVRKGLKEVEKKVLDEQPTDSDVAKAQAAFLKAKTDLDREADRVIHSPECQKRIKRVESVVDAGKLRASIRRDALENDGRYHKALLEYQYAKKEYSRLKTEVLSASTEWNSAVDAMRDAEEKARKLRQLWAGTGF
jgi:chromosome segregation ATPase